MINTKHLEYFLIGSLFLAGLSITTALLKSPRAFANNFSMLGDWSGSPDCPIVFYKDNQNYVEGRCDGNFHQHIFRGNYSNSNFISLTVTRIDPKHCQTSTPAKIRVIDYNHVNYWQAGWHGCGQETNPGTQDWYRVNN
ncbi:hypothetical protein PCC7424_5610 (plasmid) [Gloeothece citriformis PCC 7424]|uniref:Uncharacterized protein n=1 Tax=Gloeothece citriformis (strain PCC 7424) TaxID=65393 RepID=B7KMZ7_GLOC7|nr:hypothetical protein [Gloeothece citriformis]ACK74169.1 hypothetical protein PCC7424_5610 [Gloeothece citriformis PCC 7424]